MGDDRLLKKVLYAISKKTRRTIHTLKAGFNSNFRRDNIDARLIFKTHAIIF